MTITVSIDAILDCIKAKRQRLAQLRARGVLIFPSAHAPKTDDGKRLPPPLTTREPLMAASFSAPWGAPPVICKADNAVLVEGLWTYDCPKRSMRLSCGLYRTEHGDSILRVWRNGRLFISEWCHDEAILRVDAEANRRMLEDERWQAL